MFIIKLIYWIGLIALGFSIIKYRKAIKWWTGNWVWAEKYIGRWGTYFALLLFGLLLMFLWAMYPFGWLDYFKKKSQIIQNPLWNDDEYRIEE